MTINERESAAALSKFDAAWGSRMSCQFFDLKSLARRRRLRLSDLRLLVSAWHVGSSGSVSSGSMEMSTSAGYPQLDSWSEAMDIEDLASLAAKPLGGGPQGQNRVKLVYT